MILKYYQQIEEIENEVTVTLKKYLNEKLLEIGAHYDSGMGSVSFIAEGYQDLYLFELVSKLAKINGSFENEKDVEIFYHDELTKLETDLAGFLELEDKTMLEKRHKELVFALQISLILFPIIQDYLIINKKNLTNMAWPINKQQLLKFSEFLSQKI